MHPNIAVDFITTHIHMSLKALLKETFAAVTEILKASAASQLPSAVSRPSLYRTMTGPPFAHTQTHSAVLYTLYSHLLPLCTPPLHLHPYFFPLCFHSHFLSAIYFLTSPLFRALTATILDVLFLIFQSQLPVFDSHHLAFTPLFLSTVWLAGSSTCPGFTPLPSQWRPSVPAVLMMSLCLVGTMLCVAKFLSQSQVA